ncbi:MULTISPECIES: DUF1772 domain-containing protein [Hyphomonas]|uniref:DUF1772 domain-containing protein n=1 Tax=Hyphomonas atlantica TaxID=1280948 RepID=A0A059E1Q3_9PROT|nr:MULTISPECIES: anthrone oxygenase family protein [Hyphomonas]KCZ61611.1 hypothetical protein HY36_03440 [Hyphomonas atlantica]HAE93297.1 DUF1772 domain-containing protein [Hyphomonas atlantica]|tara:strand:- start:365 stop:853 length:489 start_codon:yes stop_codon:yes gene_type:complete
MSAELFAYICLAVGLAAALVGGVFQSFSDFVMAGLVRAAPSGGIESMQQINRTVFRSVFLATLLGLVPVMLVMSLLAWQTQDGAAKTMIFTGSAIYIVTVLGVTMFGNVPMNERLDRLPHRDQDAANYWKTYGVVWTRWNHVRTLGSIASAICYLLAAMALS